MKINLFLINISEKGLKYFKIKNGILDIYVWNAIGIKHLSIIYIFCTSKKSEKINIYIFCIDLIFSSKRYNRKWKTKSGRFNWSLQRSTILN